MPIARDRSCRHPRWQPLLEFARSEGWRVLRLPGGSLRLTKSGSAPIYTYRMPVASDSPQATDRNGRTEVRRG